MWIAMSRLRSGFLCYCEPKHGEFKRASNNFIRMIPQLWNLETPRFRLLRHCSLKRIWLMSNHRLIQEAYAYWKILSVSHIPSTISKECFPWAWEIKVCKRVISKNLSCNGNGKKIGVNCKMGKIFLGFSLIHIRLSDERCDIYSQFLCWLSLTYFDI